MPFAGGIMQRGYQCGMIWGAALAAGAEAHRLHGPGPQAETAAIMAAGLAGRNRIVRWGLRGTGAAIWLIGLNSLKAEGDKIEYKSTEAKDAIDRFMKCSDYRSSAPKSWGAGSKAWRTTPATCATEAARNSSKCWPQPVGSH